MGLGISLKVSLGHSVMKFLWPVSKVDLSLPEFFFMMSSHL